MQKQPLFMPDTARLITADEFERMPPPKDHRLELVKGQLVRMSLPGYEHGRIVIGFGAMLHNYAKPRRLGDVLTETGCKLESNPDTVRGPDIAFIRRERKPEASRGFFKGGPDLVVEVLSPGDRPSEVREKVDEYLTHGVLVVLVVDPDHKTVTVHRRLTPPTTCIEDDELDLDDVVAGFRCRVSEIFE
jgi:Uma2 family endonuclease